MYYIQTAGFSGNACTWWCPARKGYTHDISKAGKYTQKEALDIINNRATDTAYPCEYIDELLIARKTIIDAQYVDKKQSLLYAE